jgi:cation-transporting P-type ATPase C
MAKAVIKEAQQQGLAVTAGVTREVTLGRGVRAHWNSHLVCVGNADFMREQGLDPACFHAAAQQHMESGHTVIYVSRDGQLQGMIALGNRVRPNTDAVLGWLRRDGVERFCLISGDAQPVVRALAENLGFDDYRAPLLPQEKADYVQALQADGNRVLMLGDGVNDALALSQARIGVAMGAGGVEAAIEAADIVLVKSDLEDLVRIRRLSRRTLRTIEQNFWIANTTNLAGAVAGLSGWLTPVLAGILHVAHSLGILLNSRRLMDWRIPGKR